MKDIQRDSQRIKNITNGKIDDDSFVVGRKYIIFHGSYHNDDDYVNSILINADNSITRDEAYDIYAYLEGEASLYDSISRDNPQMDNNEWFVSLSEIYSAGVKSDELPNGYGEYGLCETNPILTISIKCSNRYLSRLRYKGDRINVNRTGSIESVVTPGSIDIYQLSTTDDQDVGKIFICPYHKHNSSKAPKGFYLNSLFMTGSII